MDVRKFLEDVSKFSAADSEVVLDGWLVIIDGSLYLLEKELPTDYKQAAKVRISDRRVIYAIRQAILPLGGGESFVFHRAKVIGLVIVESSPELIATSLYLQERGHTEMAVVDITPAALEAATTRYEAALNFDFFKEMGDT